MPSQMRLEVSTELPSETDMAALARAMHTETRLLLELAQVLRQQRQGVATDDLTMVDDSVFAANRIMRTLGEARRRRRMLASGLWSEELPLHTWSRTYARSLTAELRTAAEQLQSSADTLAREIAINRGVLSNALSAGNDLIRVLSGTSAPPVTYAAHGASEAPHTGALLNREV